MISKKHIRLKSRKDKERLVFTILQFKAETQAGNINLRAREVIYIARPRTLQNVKFGEMRQKQQRR